MQCLRTNHFWYQFSIDFSRFGPSKRKPKSSFFRTCIENADFAKIIVFLKENSYFSGLELPKLIKTRWKNAFKNNIEKNGRESDFGIHFGFQNPPKTLRKATLNEACFATLCNPPGNRRKSTGPGLC